MKTYEVIGPYPIAVIRGEEKVDVETGGTFTEDEIEPGCQMHLNVQAGLVKVAEDKTPAKLDKPAGGKQG